MTGRKAHSALNEYLNTDPTLQKEVKKQCSKVEGLRSPKEVPAEADIDDYSVDDTDIPLSAVITATVGSTSIEPSTYDEVNGRYGFVVGQVTKDSEGQLVPATVDEDIWAYDEKGEKWGTNGNIPFNGCIR